MITQIIWNGCDTHKIAADCDGASAQADGTYKLATSTMVYKSVACVEVDEAPRDEDGDLVLDGLMMTPDYRLWRAV